MIAYYPFDSANADRLLYAHAFHVHICVAFLLIAQTAMLQFYVE